MGPLVIMFQLIDVTVLKAVHRYDVNSVCIFFFVKDFKHDHFFFTLQYNPVAPFIDLRFSEAKVHYPQDEELYGGQGRKLCQDHNKL